MNELEKNIEPGEAEQSRPLTLGQVGMWVFISSEIMLFAALIGVALIFRLSALETGWPTSSEMHASLALGMLNTIFLVVSSISVLSAANAARFSRPLTAKVLLTVSVALGVAFLTIKFTEYATKYRLGLFPSAQGTQIFQKPNRRYVSAVDERLRSMATELEKRGVSEPLDTEEQGLLNRLNELQSYLSGYTARFVGRSDDRNRQDIQMRLMAHQVFPHADTTRGLEEVLTLDLTNLRSLRDQIKIRLDLATARVGPVEEQVRDLEKAVKDAGILGAIGVDEEAFGGVHPEKWLDVKRQQLTQLGVEIENREMQLKPVQGRVQMLEYFADPVFEKGFNAVLGLGLPVVITNGQSWMSVYLLLTGVHTLHLIAGLIVLGWFCTRRLDDVRAPGLYVAAMYWQFVDVAWLIIFWLVYF